MEDDESVKYWNDVSRDFTVHGEQSLWRSHSDIVNINQLKVWLGGRQFQNILKTDLFDEAVSPGLYPFLKQHALVVHGIDIAVESVNGAKARYPELEVSCNDVRDLSFDDNSFELIVSNSTLDHFRSSNEIDLGLQQFFRVLKTDGELLISLDNLQNPMVWMRNMLPEGLLKKLRITPYFVGKTYTRRGLVSALEKAGFKVLNTQPIMHCPRVLAVAFAGALQKRASTRTQLGFLTFLSRFEVLTKLPTKFFSGHFVAVRAVKPATQG